MSFLAPLFLLGGLAISLPIVFHLIRKASKEKYPFSSLMFLAPTPPRITRRSRLENLWLLLLRCGILGLLALAFARPYVMRPIPVADETTPIRQTVVLIDASASMKREGLWDNAKTRAGQVIRRASPADRVSLYSFDRFLRPLVNFQEYSAVPPDQRVARAASLLESTQPGWKGTYLGDALIEAVQLFETLEGAAAAPATKQIVLISDLQEGSHLDRLQGFEWPKGVELVLETVKSSASANAGLSPAEESADAQSRATNTVARVRVSNAANSKREQFQVRWAAPVQSEAIDIYVPPGQSRIVAAPALPQGTAGERLTLAGDDADFDNSAYFVRIEADQIEIPFIGEAAMTNATESLFYLQRAFHPTPRQSVKITPFAAVRGAELLQSPNAPLLLVTGEPSQEQEAFISQSLAAGRTVLCTLKAGADAGWLGRALNQPAFAAREADARNYSMFGQIDFQHPLFSPFADPKYSDFTKIHVWKYRHVSPESLPADTHFLARFDNGSPAFVEIPSGKGRVLLFTFSFVPSDSQFCLSSKFVPMLYSILDYSRGSRPFRYHYSVGEEVAATDNRQAATVTRPDGSSVEWPAGTRFTQTDQPGIYSVATPAGALRFSVNLETAESKTSPMDLDAFQRLGVPLTQAKDLAATAAPRKARLLPAQSLESQQKLWRWGLIAAITLLVSESLIAGWMTRRNSVPAAA